MFAAPEDSGVTGFNDLTVDRHGWLVVGALRFRPMAGEEPVTGWVVVVAKEVRRGRDRRWRGLAQRHRLLAGRRRRLISDFAHGA